MEAEELDVALEELEVRLERLRALYEQYFLGIEKLEPQIPRKDVDRRIYVLRREKIRNTGKRFKLQTLIQRYNTFQQYWQRICREIENGTYKRHLLRAEKSVGPGVLLTAAARRRFGKERGRETEPDAANPELSAMPELPADEITQKRIGTGEALKSAPPSARPPPASPRPPRPNAGFESLELDMDFMGDWDPQAATHGTSAVGARLAPASAKQTPGSRAPVRAEPVPAAEARSSADERAGGEARPAAKRLAPPPKPARTDANRAPAARASQRPPPKRRSVAPPPPAPRAGPAATSAARPSAKPPAPTTAAAQPKPSGRASVPPAPNAAARSAPTSAATRNERAARPTSELDAPVVPPSPARTDAVAEAAPAARDASTAKESASKAARAGAPARTSAKRPATLDDTKLRDLHHRLSEASKGAGQPAVSFDGLAKSLRAVEAKLRAQHGNRRIEFEVVLKNGKAAIKPVVR